jgi:SNF2 family DNA or RNA helicase
MTDTLSLTNNTSSKKFEKDIHKRTIYVNAHFDRTNEFIVFDLDQKKSGYDIYDNIKDLYIQKIFGRMFYSDYRDKQYPFFPAFLHFYSSVYYNHSDRTDYKVQENETPVTVSEEKTKAALIAALTRNLNANSNYVQRTMMQELKKSEDSTSEIVSTKVEDLSIEDELNIQSSIDQLVNDFKNTLTTMLNDKKIQFNIKKKIKTSVKIPYKLQCSTYLFDTGEVAGDNDNETYIEIECTGILSQIMSALQPSLDYCKETVRKIKLYRMFGVPESERTYKINKSTKDWEPFEHQWTMFAISMRLNRMANLSQMGTGKTPATIMNIDQRIIDGTVKAGKVLYITPAATMNGLVEHFRTYAPHLKTLIIDGSYMDRFEKIMRNDVDVKIINFEAFTMSTEINKTDKDNKPLKDEKGDPITVTLKFSDVVSCVDWNLVVIDECHKIKNPDAIRTGNIIDAFLEVPYKIIMSGTIGANKLNDVHCPYIFLNGAKTFNSVLTHKDDKSKRYSYGELYGSFLRSYFDKSGWGYKPKRGTIEELRALMETCSIRFEKSECMNLPDKVYEIRLVELSDKQQKLYNDLETYLIADMIDKAGDKEKISVTHILALNMKLAEAANGWIYDKSGYPLKFAENPKIDAVLEAIDDADDGEAKFVIWSQFKQDMTMLRNAIAKEYGDDTVEVIDGSVNFDRRFKIQQKFNDKTSRLRFVVCNVLAAGTGIDLIGASYEIYYSNSFRKVERSQSEDRCHRPGMQNKLTIIDIVAKNTIDEKVIHALKSNKAMNVALTENLGFDPNMLNLDTTEEEAVVNGNSNASVQNINNNRKHNKQKRSECVLAAIATASKDNVSIDVVREDAIALEGKAWASGYNMDNMLQLMRKYDGDQIADDYTAFLNQYIRRIEQIVDVDERLEELKKIALNMENISIPTSGKGFLHVNYMTVHMSHIVYYEDGWIYDGNETKKIEVGRWIAKQGDLSGQVMWRGEIV